MLNNEHSAMIMNQLSNNAAIQNDYVLSDIVQQIEYRLFQMLKPKLYKDGDKWCCLYGDNIQVGICGFGDTPYASILEFNKSWNKN